MRTNAMKKCAVGAMLFGGALGLAQAASAGTVTFLATAPGGGTYAEVSSLYITGLYPGGNAGVTGLGNTFTASGGSTSTGGGFQTAITATVNSTALGFELQSTRSGSTAAQWNYPSIMLSRVFSVTGGSVDWTGSLAANETGYIIPNYYQIWQLDANGELQYDAEFNQIGLEFARQGSGTFGGTLAEGNYVLYVEGRVNNGSDVPIATFAVPAPGAIALLGVAGLVGSRRRRS